jgi:hypothetical protein
MHFCCIHYVISLKSSIIFSDEKEKYDPAGFRDAVLQGLNKAGTDLEAVSKFLDTAGSKLDYRRYGEALFDILIAGGLLGKLHTPGTCLITFISLLSLDHDWVSTVLFICSLFL